MKNYFTLFLALVGFIANVNGQSFKTFTDDFEGYKNNDWLAQNSSIWTTWSGNPSTGGDDVKVVNTDSYSGSQSIYFNAGPGPEDVVLPFGGVYDEGQFLYKSMMKIPKGKSAYFNFQAGSTVGVTWAVEVNFETDSTVGFSNTRASSMMQTSYPQGRWFEIMIYINLTRNEWNVYIDGVYKGNFSNPINAVSFLDIYPADKDASYWVDDVSFTYAPPSPNNAGIARISSPLLPVCGINDLKVVVANNGINKIDSVRVNWKLDGVMQPTIYVKTAIDTARSKSTLDVTLNSKLALKKGKHDLMVWTSHPNGVADTVNFDDTLSTTLRAEVRGISMAFGTTFQGKKGAGTVAWPDSVCGENTINYGVTPPTGYTNADFGTGWVINYVNMKSNGTPPIDTLTVPPSGTNNFRLQYIADTSEAGSLFKIEISVSVGTGGCDTVLTRYVYVVPQPNTSFTANDVCLGKPTSFSVKSKGTGAINYSWKFGNATSSSQKNPIMSYGNPGTYTVTLKATELSTGCTSTTIKDVTVHEIPVAKFSAANACDSSSVVFSDATTVGGSSKITGFFWEFGDDDTAVVQNPTHIYKAPGTYKVRLTVTSDNGCSNKSNGDAVVYPTPDAAFSTTNSCLGNDVLVKNTTSYAGTSKLSYTWNFGDGTNSTDENPSHLYTPAGLYTIVLKATSVDGCMDSLVRKVEVYPLPEADFNLTNICLGDSIFFTDNSSITSGSIANYSWKFGDNRTSELKDPVHTYRKANKFTVELMVTSNNGCLHATTKEVEVYALPIADFAAENACEDVEVSFDNKSTTTSDTLEYVWNFGDGNTAIDQFPKNVYNTAGTYPVKLQVTTENGCVHNTESSIEIYALPNAGFSFDDKGFMQFDFAADDADLASYFWDFGDGNTSTDVAPFHEYATTGTYDVTLKTINNNGCESETTSQVSVTTGMAENGAIVNPFSVFPNPFKEQVNIAYQLQNTSNVTIEVYNLNGKLLMSLANQKQLSGEYQYNFTTPDASGIYMLRMVINENVYHERIVKAQ